MIVNIEQRINEVSDGIIGVFTALMAARQALGDEIIVQFMDKVPEKGEALWVCFRNFQKAHPATDSFNHFIASVIMG